MNLPTINSSIPLYYVLSFFRLFEDGLSQGTVVVDGCLHIVLTYMISLSLVGRCIFMPVEVGSSLV